MSAPGASERAIDINAIISWILIAGVGLSALTLAVGLGLFLADGGAHGSIAQALSSSPHGLLKTFGGVVRGVSRADPDSVLELGVIILLATPVIRVAASIFLFLAERDWLYTLLTTLVLAILLFSIFKVG